MFPLFYFDCFSFDKREAIIALLLIKDNGVEK